MVYCYLGLHQNDFLSPTPFYQTAREANSPTATQTKTKLGHQVRKKMNGTQIKSKKLPEEGSLRKAHACPNCEVPPADPTWK